MFPHVKFQIRLALFHFLVQNLEVSRIIFIFASGIKTYYHSSSETRQNSLFNNNINFY